MSLEKILPDQFPGHLAHIPDRPKHLYVAGSLPDDVTHYLAVIGSRAHTQYGRQACQQIIGELSGYPICIVSGLALGIDAVAHKAAIRAGLPTFAVPGSGLDEHVLYPASNRGLAKDIIGHGGALISEFEPDMRAARWVFPKRNRIMAGIADMVLVIEATHASGTLITARLAHEYGRDVGAIPGDIHMPSMAGNHALIQQGALLVTSGQDILDSFGFEEGSLFSPRPAEPQNLGADENLVYNALVEPMARQTLLEHLNWDISRLSQACTLLEIKGYVAEHHGMLARTRMLA